MTDLYGKRVMVVGLGLTGRSVAHFLHARGAKLVLIDQRGDLDCAGLPPGEVRLGAAGADLPGGVELVVTSPGVPRSAALLRAASAAAVTVISEIDLAARFLSVPIVAITGTNGKSTVTVLVGEMLKAAGRRPFVGGNLGRPLIEAAGADCDAAVAEVSSFQLEWIDSFRPRVAVHLNLADDHFDRYRDLADYGRAKAELFRNQQAGDWAILNRDDANVWELRRRLRSQVASFGFNCAETRPAIWQEGNWLTFDDGAHRQTVNATGLRLRGRHNLANAMAASAAALAMGAGPGAIERALAGFAGLPHRTQLVRETSGVTFIDDSKGTNVAAVVEALAAVAPPIILIAGGLDKGGDYAPLREPLRQRVKLAILIGAAREKMRAALAGSTAIELLPTLAEAVGRAAAVAVPGDTVLLSPACSSFDQFKDYAERGRIFEELVRAL